MKVLFIVISWSTALRIKVIKFPFEIKSNDYLISILGPITGISPFPGQKIDVPGSPPPYNFDLIYAESFLPLHRHIT